MVFDRDRLSHLSVGVETGMLAAGHRDRAELTRGRAVNVHVPSGGERVVYRRGHRPEGMHEILPSGREFSMAPAFTRKRLASARRSAKHSGAEAGFDGAHGGEDHRARRAAA
jgi:hypothetical protein